MQSFSGSMMTQRMILLAITTLMICSIDTPEGFSLKNTFPDTTTVEITTTTIPDTVTIDSNQLRMNEIHLNKSEKLEESSTQIINTIKDIVNIVLDEHPIDDQKLENNQSKLVVTDSDNEIPPPEALIADLKDDSNDPPLSIVQIPESDNEEISSALEDSIRSSVKDEIQLEKMFESSAIDNIPDPDVRQTLTDELMAIDYPQGVKKSEEKSRESELYVASDKDVIESRATPLETITEAIFSETSQHPKAIPALISVHISTSNSTTATTATSDPITTPIISYDSFSLAPTTAATYSKTSTITLGNSASFVSNVSHENEMADADNADLAKTLNIPVAKLTSTTTPAPSSTPAPIQSHGSMKSPEEHTNNVGIADPLNTLPVTDTNLSPDALTHESSKTAVPTIMSSTTTTVGTSTLSTTPSPTRSTTAEEESYIVDSADSSKTVAETKHSADATTIKMVHEMTLIPTEEIVHSIDEVQSIEDMKPIRTRQMRGFSEESSEAASETEDNSEKDESSKSKFSEPLDSSNSSASSDSSASSHSSSSNSNEPSTEDENVAVEDNSQEETVAISQDASIEDNVEQGSDAVSSNTDNSVEVIVEPIEVDGITESSGELINMVTVSAGDGKHVVMKKPGVDEEILTETTDGADENVVNIVIETNTATDSVVSYVQNFSKDTLLRPTETPLINASAPTHSITEKNVENGAFSENVDLAQATEMSIITNKSTIATIDAKNAEGNTLNSLGDVPTKAKDTLIPSQLSTEAENETTVTDNHFMELEHKITKDLKIEGVDLDPLTVGIPLENAPRALKEIQNNYTDSAPVTEIEETTKLDVNTAFIQNPAKEGDNLNQMVEIQKNTEDRQYTNTLGPELSTVSHVDQDDVDDKSNDIPNQTEHVPITVTVDNNEPTKISATYVSKQSTTLDDGPNLPIQTGKQDEHKSIEIFTSEMPVDIKTNHDEAQNIATTTPGLPSLIESEPADVSQLNAGPEQNEPTTVNGDPTDKKHTGLPSQETSTEAATIQHSVEPFQEEIKNNLVKFPSTFPNDISKDVEEAISNLSPQPELESELTRNFESSTEKPESRSNQELSTPALVRTIIEAAELTTELTRHVDSFHTTGEETAAISDEIVSPAAAGRSSNTITAEGVGKPLPTRSVGDAPSTSSYSSEDKTTTVVVLCSAAGLIFVAFSVAMYLITFQRQHGTLDIEMQEQRCGKDNLEDDDDDAETRVTLLNQSPPIDSEEHSFD